MDKLFQHGVLFTNSHKNYSVRSNEWRYIRYRDGSEELYNHKTDPGEHKNLAYESVYANIIAEHKKWLPKKDASPATAKKWEGDMLDRRIEQWMTNDSIPVWLR